MIKILQKSNADFTTSLIDLKDLQIPEEGIVTLYSIHIPGYALLATEEEIKILKNKV